MTNGAENQALGDASSMMAAQDFVATGTDGLQERAARRWPEAIALLIAGAILGLAGFAPGIAHNAAHDVRHTVAFPCH